MIAAADIDARLRGLDAIGCTRLAWTAEDEAAGAWFAEQAAALGLRVARDAAGNRWACPDAPPPWWGVGSHLDTVADGGRYDGALGVACGFEIARAVELPVAVVSFADEEGARFNTPTFGSRALVGRLDVEEVLARADADGVTLRAAMTAAGVDPDGLRDAPSSLGRLRGFLEVHIDQTPTLTAPAAAVRALAGRMRVRVDVTGAADHAGTTRGPERHDALAAAARLCVIAEDLAGFPVTPTRILAAPNALSTINASVHLWLDARHADIAEVDGWRARLEDAVGSVAERYRVRVALRTESRSPGVSFDRAVVDALGGGELVCFAGHDAGVLAERIPAGMVLVRNPSGVSHAPEEDVSLDDAAVAARTAAAALERLA